MPRLIHNRTVAEVQLPIENCEVLGIPIGEFAPCFRRGVHHILLMFSIFGNRDIHNQRRLCRIDNRFPSEVATVVSRRLGEGIFDLER